jgi:DNA modification methylase
MDDCAHWIGLYEETDMPLLTSVSAPALDRALQLEQAAFTRLPDSDLQARSGLCAISKLVPHPANTRVHSKKQIKKLARAIGKTNFNSPVVVDEDLNILAGHARVMAQRLRGQDEIYVFQVCGLTKAQQRLYLISDNRVAEDAKWDREKLAGQFPELESLFAECDFKLEDTGFETAEIDQLKCDFEEDSADPADLVPDQPETPVAKLGDQFALDGHFLHVGDARNLEAVSALMRGEFAAAGIHDVPYNVKVRSISGRGKTKHAEFAMASGEMPPPQYIAFLKCVLGNAARFCRDGSHTYVFMDWKHIAELIAAGKDVFSAMANLAVWVKTNAGQGGMLRSQHELIGIFRVGEGAVLDNVQKGRFGCNRSNVWHYPGVNAFRAGRADDLAAHPTVKPVALVADALKDCTRRGDIVLDCFSGSGTTILAAERVGRRARALEIEPKYVDVSIRRWEQFTGRDAIHIQTGLTFSELAEQRLAPPARVRIRTRA